MRSSSRRSRRYQQRDSHSVSSSVDPSEMSYHDDQDSRISPMIDNIHDIKPVVQPRKSLYADGVSLRSQRSGYSSRSACDKSSSSRRSRRKGLSLEQVISQTILETSAAGEASTSTLSTDLILQDLESISSSVQEESSRKSRRSKKQLLEPVEDEPLPVGSSSFEEFLGMKRRTPRSSLASRRTDPFDNLESSQYSSTLFTVSEDKGHVFVDTAGSSDVGFTSEWTTFQDNPFASPSAESPTSVAEFKMASFEDQYNIGFSTKASI